MRRFVVFGAIALAALGLVFALGLGSGRQSARAQGVAALKPIQRRLLSGFATRALEQPAPPPLAPLLQSQRQAPGTTTENRGSNVRVNQDCLNLSDPDLQGRGQAQNETAIAQDPGNPARMVTASNDYRRDDSGCYTYVSANNGRRWQDSTPPLGFTRGTAFGGAARQYWEASGDPSVAWDTKGNAYLTCLTFQRGAGVTPNPDLSSAFCVLRSTGTGGASWNFPGRPVAQFDDTAGAGTTLLDKPYMTVDTTSGSPFQDRIYVTYTLFAADGTSYIYAANSREYGESFSAPKLVSTTSDLCTNDQGAPTP
jgi:hypothetical protein